MARRRKPLLHLTVKNTSGKHLASFSSTNERQLVKWYTRMMKQNTHLTTANVQYTSPHSSVVTVRRTFR